MTHPHPLQASMREMSQALRAALASTSGFQHNLTAGEAREAKFIDALAPFIPERFGIVSGIATNAQGDVSAQQDALFFDRVAGAPFVRVRDQAVLPVEVVSASVQVKTSISASDLKGIVDNLASIKRLLSSGPRPVLSISAGGVEVTGATTKPFAGALAFSGARSEPELMYAFAMASQEIPDPLDRPDAVAILDRGLMVWAYEHSPDGERQLGVSPDRATHMAWIPAAEEAMLLFYLFLINGLASHLQPPYSPGEYMAAAGVLGSGSWLASLSEIGFEVPGEGA